MYADMLEGTFPKRVLKEHSCRKHTLTQTEIWQVQQTNSIPTFFRTGIWSHLKQQRHPVTSTIRLFSLLFLGIEYLGAGHSVYSVTGSLPLTRAKRCVARQYVYVCVLCVCCVCVVCVCCAVLLMCAEDSEVGHLPLSSR